MFCSIIYPWLIWYYCNSPSMCTGKYTITGVYHSHLPAKTKTGKHEGLTPCYFNVRPASATLAQHWTSTGSTPGVCWGVSTTRPLSYRSDCTCVLFDFTYSPHLLVISSFTDYIYVHIIRTRLRRWHLDITVHVILQCSSFVIIYFNCFIYHEYSFYLLRSVRLIFVPVWYR